MQIDLHHEFAIYIVSKKKQYTFFYKENKIPTAGLFYFYLLTYNPSVPCTQVHKWEALIYNLIYLSFSCAVNWRYEIFYSCSEDSLNSFAVREPPRRYRSQIYKETVLSSCVREPRAWENTTCASNQPNTWLRPSLQWGNSKYRSSGKERKRERETVVLLRGMIMAT